VNYISGIGAARSGADEGMASNSNVEERRNKDIQGVKKRERER